MKKIVLILLVGSFSCEMVVDIDVPIERRKITVNSFFSADSVWKAHISLSRHILDDYEFTSLNDAHVILMQNEIVIDTLVSEAEGFYASDSGKPVIGSSYELKVESEKYGMVSARSSLPQPVGLSGVNFFIPAPPTTPGYGWGQDLATVTIRLQDLPETNYYEVSLLLERKYYYPSLKDTLTSHSLVHLESLDAMFESVAARSDGAMVFNDILFNGKEKSIEFRFNPYDVYWNKDSKLKLHFKTLSPDLYQYKVTAELQRHVSGDPFAQPVKVYNNITNGFGIFAGYSEVIYEYKK